VFASIWSPRVHSTSRVYSLASADMFFMEVISSHPKRFRPPAKLGVFNPQSCLTYSKYSYVAMNANQLSCQTPIPFLDQPSSRRTVGGLLKQLGDWRVILAPVVRSLHEKGIKSQTRSIQKSNNCFCGCSEEGISELCGVDPCTDTHEEHVRRSQRITLLESFANGPLGDQIEAKHLTAHWHTIARCARNSSGATTRSFLPRVP